jgi:hypothetical protein
VFALRRVGYVKQAIRILNPCIRRRLTVFVLDQYAVGDGLDEIAVIRALGSPCTLSLVQMFRARIPNG